MVFRVMPASAFLLLRGGFFQFREKDGSVWVTLRGRARLCGWAT